MGGRKAKRVDVEETAAEKESGPQFAVHCAHTQMVPIERLVGNPRNPNTHPLYQIDVLAKIIAAQGWRAPITVSRRSGFVVRGHGRLRAAMKLGCTEVPVDFQDYENEAAEYADLVADNRIAELAEMDMEALRAGLLAINDGTFDLTLSGFDVGDLAKMLEETFPAANDPEAEWTAMPEFEQPSKLAYRSIIVHLDDEEEVAAFGKLLGRTISPAARYLWFNPDQEKGQDNYTRVVAVHLEGAAGEER
jgi:ParB-like chromosome segregation protein Spo0J